MQLTPQSKKKLGPPADWTSGEVWQALSERPKPSAVVELPLKTYSGGKLPAVRIQVLRRDEQTRCELAARATVKALGFDAADLDTDPVARVELSNQSALETLAKAVCSVKSVGTFDEDGLQVERYGTVFRDASDVARMLQSDELEVLWTQYKVIQRERGPLYSGGMDDEDIEAWVTTLAEGASQVPLARLTLPQLATLCLSLARKISSLRSSGSNPDAPPSEPSPNGQESPEAIALTGTSFFGAVPAGPGLESSTPDDGSVPNGATPEEAAEIALAISEP